VSDEPYHIDWARSGLRALERLPGKVATACVEFIHGQLAEDPARVGHRLRLELAGKHSARRGDFRVIYEINDATHTVTIIAIEHRSDVYRQR
jgi:mRNA-degrading endonuclease RelE of RelBE toxin-antitoxin system